MPLSVGGLHCPAAGSSFLFPSLPPGPVTTGFEARRLALFVPGDPLNLSAAGAALLGLLQPTAPLAANGSGPTLWFAPVGSREGECEWLAAGVCRCFSIRFSTGGKDWPEVGSEGREKLEYGRQYGGIQEEKKIGNRARWQSGQPARDKNEKVQASIQHLGSFGDGRTGGDDHAGPLGGLASHVPGWIPFARPRVKAIVRERVAVSQKACCYSRQGLPLPKREHWALGRGRQEGTRDS
jgi:hypothetical protein